MKKGKTCWSLLMLTAALMLALGACQSSPGAPADPQEPDAPLTADEYLGIWAEKIAGRGTIEITEGETAGEYQIFVNWGSSAFETYQWQATGVAKEENGQHVLSYSDCINTIITFSESEEETTDTVYEDGTGTMALNADGEIVWDDAVNHIADDTSFVRVE